MSSGTGSCFVFSRCHFPFQAVKLAMCTCIFVVADYSNFSLSCTHWVNVNIIAIHIPLATQTCTFISLLLSVIHFKCFFSVSETTTYTLLTWHFPHIRDIDLQLSNGKALPRTLDYTQVIPGKLYTLLFPMCITVQCSCHRIWSRGCRGVEFKALVSNPAPILHECHYCTTGCCVLACV